MHRNDISNYSVTESLRDGRTVTIRAVRPDDKGGMADALREMSPESIFRRTFSPKRDLGDADLKRLTDVDFQNIVALVAVMREEGQDRIVGGGRYIRMGGTAPQNAEVAFLIDDEHQGLGIGSRIFRRLVVIARASAITSFEADVLPSNNSMLRLFERSGLPLTKSMTRDAIHVTIALDATAAPGNTGQASTSA